MRKIILGVAVSLDSFIEGPNGEYDWCFTDQDYGMNEFMESIDAVFYGRKSWEVAQGAGGGDMFGHLKSYVFSNTMKKEHDNFQIVSGDIISKVQKIRSEPGKNIWLFGGAVLTENLMNAGLVDELWLSVHPLLLGKGTPLFRGQVRRILTELLSCKTYDTGLVSLRYKIGK